MKYFMAKSSPTNSARPPVKWSWTQASQPHKIQTNVNCIRSPPTSDMKPFLVLAWERQMKLLPREGFRIDMETSSSYAKLKTCPKKVWNPQAWHIFFFLQTGPALDHHRTNKCLHQVWSCASTDCFVRMFHKDQATNPKAKCSKVTNELIKYIQNYLL
jgi:hypothetical protein